MAGGSLICTRFSRGSLICTRFSRGSLICTHFCWGLPDLHAFFRGPPDLPDISLGGYLICKKSFLGQSKVQYLLVLPSPFVDKPCASHSPWTCLSLRAASRGAHLGLGSRPTSWTRVSSARATRAARALVTVNASRAAATASRDGRAQLVSSATASRVASMGNATLPVNVSATRGTLASTANGPAAPMAAPIVASALTAPAPVMMAGAGPTVRGAVARRGARGTACA